VTSIAFQLHVHINRSNVHWTFLAYFLLTRASYNEKCCGKISCYSTIKRNNQLHNILTHLAICHIHYPNNRWSNSLGKSENTVGTKETRSLVGKAADGATRTCEHTANGIERCGTCTSSGTSTSTRSKSTSGTK
jgi:hypothetical protein